MLDMLHRPVTGLRKLLQASKRSQFTIAATLFLAPWRARSGSGSGSGSGCGVRLHLELLAVPLGFLQLPSEEHYLLPVA